MNKKSLAMLLFAATLGLGSCNDIQDLNLNFGDRTYINDYKGLIDAVNNLNLSLKERMDALSQLLKEGLADIKVSIDANTGAIKIVGQNIVTLDGDIKDGLSTINTTLFNGFQAVCTQIDATGNTIVAAIDNNGNLLRLQIDSTGKLISAQLLTSTEDLIKVLKENNASLAEKLGLIDAAIQAGFASTAQGQKDIKEAVKEAIAALAAEVKAGNKSNADALAEIKTAIANQTTTLETKLAAIEQANKEGLATLAQKNDLINAAIAALNESVKSQTISIEKKLADIETATKNGLATLAEKNDLIDASIKALAAEVKAGNKSNADALAELKTAVANQTTSLGTKLAAIETANKEGLATLAQKNDLTKEAINALAAEVKAGNKSNEDALKEIKAVIASQTTSLADKIALVQSAVATGFANENTTLASMTSDLKTAIDNLKTEVQNGNTSNATYLSQMVSGLTTLNTTMGTTNTQLGNIKDVLTKELADNGVTINPDGDGKSILVTPDIWNDIEKAGATSQLYNTFMDAIKDVTVPKVVNPTQVTPGTWHTCARFVNDGYDANSVHLRAGTLQPMTAANGKTVIKVIKTPDEVKFHITNLQNCTYQWLYNIRVYDARGDYQVYGGATGIVTGSRAEIGEAKSLPVPTTQTHGDNITIYLKAYYNGRICDEVKAYVFSYQYNSTLPNLFWPSTPDPKP